MKNIVIPVCVISLATICSCKWNDKVYEHFVDRSTESIKACDIENSYIEYLQTGQSGFLQCEANHCPSKDDCCGFADKKMREKFKQAFENNMCPVGFLCETDIKNGKDIHYCTQSNKKCYPGTHYDDMTATCVNNDEKNCGGNDCTKTPGWSMGYCDGNDCYPTECTGHYHLVNQNVAYPMCEEDTIEHCGPNRLDCTAKPDKGEKYSVCNLETLKCEVTKCESGYHFDSTNEHCEANTVHACGSYNFDCTRYIVGWANGSCVKNDKNEFVCVVEDCAVGYHTYDNQCEPDTNEHCGSHDNSCVDTVKPYCTKKSDSSDYDCAAACSEGLKPCANGCFDVRNDPDNCGDCGVKCSDSAFPKAVENTCKSYVCVPSLCENGYHVDGDACVEDDEENCGTKGNACPNYLNADRKCVKGSCEMTCQEGFSDCDNDTSNGCEIELIRMGLESCDACAASYKASVWQSGVPLCVRMGNSWQANNELWSKYREYCNKCRPREVCDIYEDDSGKSSGYDVGCSEEHVGR